MFLNKIDLPYCLVVFCCILPWPQFLQKFKAEMLQFHVHSLDSQFLPQIVHQRSFFLLLDQLLNFELGSSKLPWTRSPIA